MASSKPIPAHQLKTTSGGKLRRRNVLWRMRRLLFAVMVVLITGVAGVGFVLSQVDLPPREPPQAQTSFICAADVLERCNGSNAMAQFNGEVNRINVTLDEVPEVMIQATVSAEDRDFFDHEGVDPWGIARAAWADISEGEVRQGGSTITQQYVKAVYLTSERTVTRKVKEAVMAMKLEQQISKEEILERYLNTVYFGRGAYGVEAASQAYFGKRVGELNLHEAALLAGLIRAPEAAEPTRDPDEARARRSNVLRAMDEEGYITTAERQFAEAIGFGPDDGVLPRDPSEGTRVLQGGEHGSAYFVEHVRRWLVDRYGEQAVYGGGLRVYTSLDLNMQRAAYEAVTGTLDQPDDPAGSLVAVDEGGYVRAMMGGRDYEASQVNLATGLRGGGSGRQPGSTFKPFALAAAIQDGYSIQSEFASPSSVTLDAGGGEDWRVRGGCCGGSASLLQATARSTNTVYAQLMLELGPERVIRMARDLGISAELPEVPSLVLGSGEVSVLDMASGYSTFANGGIRKDPMVVTRVERADGSLVESFTPTQTEVLNPEQNSIVTYALEQVINGGTGSSADFGIPAAGKTGTTQNNVDAWFVGFTPRLTAATWMGYPGGPGEPQREMESVHGQTVQGGNLPAEMWQRFMEDVTGGQSQGDFPEPDDLSAGDTFDPDVAVPDDDPPETAPETAPETSDTTDTTVPETTVPEETVPEETVPEETVPEETVPPEEPVEPVDTG